MARITIKNCHAQGCDIVVGGMLINNGDTAEVNEIDVSNVQIKKGNIVVVELPEVELPEVEEAEVPEIQEGVDEKTPIELIIEEIKADPSIICADDFTQSGIPKVEALEALAGVDFTAAGRDEIWAQVSDLYEKEAND